MSARARVARQELPATDVRVRGWLQGLDLFDDVLDVPEKFHFGPGVGILVESRASTLVLSDVPLALMPRRRRGAPTPLGTLLGTPYIYVAPTLEADKCIVAFQDPAKAKQFYDWTHAAWQHIFPGEVVFRVEGHMIGKPRMPNVDIRVCWATEVDLKPLRRAMAEESIMYGKCLCCTCEFHRKTHHEAWEQCALCPCQACSDTRSGRDVTRKYQ